MSESAISDRPPWRRHLLLACVALVPLLLCAVLSWTEARRHERREAMQVADLVRNRAESILGHARLVAGQLLPLTEQPCAPIANQLARVGSLEPYFRSVLLTDHDRIYCSSIDGPVDYPLSSVKAFPARVPGKPWTRMVSGSPLMPDRPALLVEKSGGARSVLTIVDGQHLLDLLQAVAPLGGYSLELRVGDGIALRGGVPEATREMTSMLFEGDADVSGTRIGVRVHGLRARLYAAWHELLQRFMPFAVLLSGVLVFLCHRLQQGRRSEREQLLRAIRDGEFRVEYQPVYSAAEDRCEGAEALLRWDRPGTGPVRPDTFIATAEQTHVIVPLTRHLLEMVARDFRGWQTRPGFHLGINLAAEHLSSPGLLADMRAFLAEVSARQPVVVLEITERGLVENPEQAQRNLHALRAEGVRVAIDDFGTGYCALSYLQRFPFDLLKVDKGFVQAIDPEQGNAPVLDTIIGLAQRLGAGLVAEGVERPVQFDYLRARGVSFMQGFLYARPMPPLEFARWYASAGQRRLPSSAGEAKKSPATPRGNYHED